MTAGGWTASAPDELRLFRRTQPAARRRRDVSWPIAARRPCHAASWKGRSLYAAELWKAIAEMGWTGAAIPEEYGGVGLGPRRVCVLAEELGRAVAPVPFSSSVYLATEALMLFGSEQQKQALPAEIGGRRHHRHVRPGRTARARPTRETSRPGERRQADRHQDGRCRMAISRISPSSRCTARHRAWLHLVDLSGPASAARRSRRSTRRVHQARSFSTARLAEPLPGAPDRKRRVAELLDCAAVPDGVRAGRRRPGGARHGQRLCQGTLRVRAADRLVSRRSSTSSPTSISRSSWHAPTPITAPGRAHRRRGTADRRRRSRASRRRDAVISRRRRTSRRMAAWGSPGRWTAISTIAAPSCLRWRWAARGLEATADRRSLRTAERGVAGRRTMDFEDTPEEAAFRAEARAFLDANAERRKPGAVEGYSPRPGCAERDGARQGMPGARRPTPALSASTGRRNGAAAAARRSRMSSTTRRKRSTTC